MILPYRIFTKTQSFFWFEGSTADGKPYIRYNVLYIVKIYLWGYREEYEITLNCIFEKEYACDTCFWERHKDHILFYIVLW